MDPIGMKDLNASIIHLNRERYLQLSLRPPEEVMGGVVQAQSPGRNIQLNLRNLKGIYLRHVLVSFSSFIYKKRRQISLTPSSSIPHCIDK
jgi:hypothetical protein